MKSLCLLLATLVSAGCASSSQPVAETPPKPAPAPAAKLVLPTPPSPAAGQAAPAAKRVVVWDGEQANKGAGWTNPTTCTIGPQTAEVHSGNACCRSECHTGIIVCPRFDLPRLAHTCGSRDITE